MSSHAIKASGVRATLGRTEVLHGIDLTIEQGRWTALVGPNGAGKSTLLKALAGLLPHGVALGRAGARLFVNQVLIVVVRHAVRNEEQPLRHGHRRPCQQQARTQATRAQPPAYVHVDEKDR